MEPLRQSSYLCEDVGSQGTLYVSASKKGGARVSTGSECDVMLSDKKAVNRGLHGDQVAGQFQLAS